ncbi:MAG: hypothetical protein JWM11_3443 [Planctomycetaceae bacterium]|nr:hypothetical protein [Planctomycetaceae bacterium]
MCQARVWGDAQLRKRKEFETNEVQESVAFLLRGNGGIGGTNLYPGGIPEISRGLSRVSIDTERHPRIEFNRHFDPGGRRSPFVLRHPPGSNIGPDAGSGGVATCLGTLRSTPG